MHARELAVMASWIMGHSDRLELSCKPASCQAVRQYWSSCNGRMQRWMRALGNRNEGHHRGGPQRAPWTVARVVVEEILLSEVLARTWAGFVWDREKLCPDPDMRTVVLHVHAQQGEARNVALRLLVASDPRRDQPAVQINQLRRQLERWTDLCLARLTNPGVGVRFAFDPRRMMSFRSGQGRGRCPEPQGELDRWSHVFSEDLENSTIHRAANPAWNQEIASGIIACLESERLDKAGWPGVLCGR